MLALLGFATIIIMLSLIMTKKVSPVVALIVVPIVTATIGGFGEDIGRFVASGIVSIAPTGVMFIFAILFFGVLTDAGTFQPLIKNAIKFGGSDPLKITVATSVVSMLAHLDGAGATTFLIVVPPMLILYKAVGMRNTTLATIVALSAGTMNMVPWSAVPLRAATAVGGDVSSAELVGGIIIPLAAGLLMVIGISYFLGLKERKLVGFTSGSGNSAVDSAKMEQILKAVLTVDEEKAKLMRPKLIPLNVITILATVVVLVLNLMPAHTVFMLAFSFALVVNYPKVADQRARVDAHAKSALMMASVLFAAGALIGITRETGMITEMAAVAVNLIPDTLGRFIAIFIGILAMPLSLLFDPDSFYLGILPVLMETAESFGIEGINVARAALLGQMTTGFPVSPLTPATFLLVGLADVDIGEHQKKTIPLAFAVSNFMLLVAVLTGAIAF